MKNSEEKNIEHIIKRMLTDRSVDAPQDAVTYARNLYRTRATEPKASIIQRLLAVMQVDLAPNRAAFGERSASGSQARQMLFDSGENAVDLRITDVDGKFDIRGQILGDGFSNGIVEIANEKTSIKAKTDEMSGFKISALPTGEYSLTVKGIDTEIVIEQLILK
jgi:hypothetical protein